MRFHHQLVYDAPPADVFAMLSDAAFRERVCEAQGVVSCEVTLTPSGDGFVLTNDQMQNTAGLPALAKKIAGDTTRAVTSEEWPDARGGRLEITAPGKPTQAHGMITLAVDGEGTRMSVELDILVKVPLIAGRLEQLMADNIAVGYDVEHQVGAAWLEGER